MTKVFRKIWVGVLIIACCMVNFSPPQLAAALADTNTETRIAECFDVTLIFARGSGERLNDVSYGAWKNANQEALARLNLDISYNFYELGSAPQFGAQYPAVAVSGDVEAIGTMLGAFVSGGASFNFGASVEEGSRELLNYIGKVSAACPDTQYVLGGYSQGAMLISRVLDQINSDKVIYVATFGDPKLYLPEGKGNHPVACSGKNLSNYRAYVSDCHAYEGILGSYRPYQPTGYYNKLGTYCNSQDIMCSSGMSISDHTSYTSRGLYQVAAQTIASRVRSAFRPEIADINEVISSHDLLLIFDITYGMQTHIDNYLAEAKALVQRTRSLGGRVALYTVRQSSAQYSTLRPVILQVCDFSCSPEELNYQINQLNNRLAPSSTVGGLPIYMALNQAMRKLDWQVGATKTAVVFTNNFPRNTDHDGSTLESIVNLSLAIDPVNIYALVSNESVAQSIDRLTSATNGQTYIISEEFSGLVEAVTGRPLARLALETYSGLVGDEFTFDASGESLAQELSTLRYDWDLDADGIFEIQDSTPTIQHVYTKPVSGYLQVRVTDTSGYSSTMSARLEVVNTLESPSQISVLETNRTSAQEFQIKFQTDAPRVLVVLNDAILGFIDAAAQQSLTLSDIAQTSELRLVPYSATGIRGESADITLDLSEEITPPKLNSPTVSETPEAPQTPTPDISISHLPIKNRPVFVPKVPNTGYFVD